MWKKTRCLTTQREKKVFEKMRASKTKARLSAKIQQKFWVFLVNLNFQYKSKSMLIFDLFCKSRRKTTFSHSSGQPSYSRHVHINCTRNKWLWSQSILDLCLTVRRVEIVREKITEHIKYNSENTKSLDILQVFVSPKFIAIFVHWV